MAVYAGPKLTTTGAKLILDSTNPKSYPGSGNTFFNLAASNNGSATTIQTINDSVAGSVINFNSSTAITISFSPAINHESWSMIYWIRSTGLTSSNYRQVIRIDEDAASHNYFYLVDTRETTNSYILGFQKDFLINSWLTYSHMTAAQWAEQRWWCLGVSHNNTVFKHYTNGALVNTQTQTRAVGSYTDVTSIILNGSSANTVLLGSFQFYEGILTDQEFRDNFNAYRGRYGI
jgi:hypothetical protein